jgi:hypothetical protein
MPEDPRNCGSPACIVNPKGYCWCGLKWDGQKMARAPLQPLPAAPKAKPPVRKAAKKTKAAPRK